MENETTIHENPTTSTPLSSAQNNLPNNVSDNPNQPYNYDDADITPARLDKKQFNQVGVVLVIVGALFFGSFSVQSLLGNGRNAASAPAEWVVFGSSQKHISEAKRNLATRSIFGEMEVDLRPLEGKIKQGEMHLHVQTVFAETRVIVPDSWQVNVDNNAILGEVSNRSNSNTDGTVTLHVEGSTVFGETRISN